jgi:hypothetical protein
MSKLISNLPPKIKAIAEKVRDRDETVIVKISKCQECNGTVRVAVKHLMNKKSIKEFSKEVIDYNLSVSEIKLEDYRKNNVSFCECK